MPSTISAGTASGTALNLSGDTTGNLAFQTNGTTTAMTINTSQNVGIGTTTPANPLVVSNAGAAGIEINSTSINSYNRSTSAWVDITYSANQQIFNSAGTTERMRIASDGDVLIGRTAPFATEKVLIFQSTNAVGLCVSSESGPAIGNYESADSGRNAWWTFGRDNSITGNFIFAYNNSAVASINLTTGVYTALSDARVKKNITDLNYGLAEVMAMRPVSYLMNQEEDTAKKHLGFIAQEVKAVMDEAVDDLIDHDTQFYGLDKSGLVPVLVKAIQELKATVDAQAARIAALESN
jgi:hypothetical protein